MSKKIFYNKRIRLHFIWGLIFSFLFIACSQKNSGSDIVIQWRNNKAESVLIPLQLLPALEKDSLSTEIQIRLKNIEAAIIGDYYISDGAVIFQPIIPFSNGLKYEVYFQKKLAGQFEIPVDTTATAPEIVSIYPSADTVPLNLMKIYILFSKPMQEGEAVKHITVIKNDVDTISSIFLDLENELWNKERTLLTVWLDPGRIKRDLQPNKQSGTPLQAGNHYTIAVKQDWRSADGKALAFSYNKKFYVSTADASSPDPAYWTIVSPKAKTIQPLLIHLHEALDYSLLKNAVRITDSKGNFVEGSFETTANETTLSFIPAKAWATGNYTIKIEPRLEDLAGNNLNRLFDNDLTLQAKKVPKNLYTRSFYIQ